MDLNHRFTVPTTVEETWAHFNDIAAVAECFPGAVVTDATDQAFAGSVKVKLGPIALLYNGSGTFVEKDEDGHRFVVEAKGKDKRGNGTAGANVTVTMTASGGPGEGTEVEVLTDLAITGKPAQFGRGVMQDVSDKLLGKFVECLEQRLTPAPPEDAGDASVPSGMGADQSVPSESTPTGAAASAPLAGDSAAGPSSAPGAAPLSPGAGGSSSQADDALDLGSAVLPVLIKSYGPKLAAAAVLVALIHLVIHLVMRRRRG